MAKMKKMARWGLRRQKFALLGGRKLSLFRKVLALTFLLILLSASVSASAYNFFVFNPQSIERQALEEIPSPNITSASAYPEKVMPGQVLLVTAEVESMYAVKSAIAIFENENEPVEMNMLLISGTKNKGIYEARWIAQNTKAQQWYNTTIIFTNIFNKKSEAIVTWQDPTTTHKASEITGGGTFGSGDYAFPGTVNVSQSLNLMDDYTKLLLHFSTSTNGTNASQAIDSSGQGKTVAGSYGQAHLDTQYSKFGGSSARFDGTGDYITYADSGDWDFGTSAFTIDFWMKYNALPAIASALVGNDHSIALDGWGTTMMADGTVRFRNDDTNVISSSSPVTSGWNHIAVVRSGNTVTLYLDGVSKGTYDATGVSIDGASTSVALAVGTIYANSPNYYINGSLDEVRISKGTARWTSAFSVPTNEYGTAKFGDVNIYGDLNISGQSRARAYRATSAQSIPTATLTKVQLNAESYDNQNEFDSTTNYRFTAKKAGYYLVAAEVTYDNPTADKRVDADIYKNGVVEIYTIGYPALTDIYSAHTAYIVYLAANDYLELWTYHESGVSEDIGANIDRTFMTIHKLS